MASYRLSYDSYSVTFRVTGLTSGQYVGLYLRFENGTTGIIDEPYTATGASLTKTFNVLIPGEKYAANVRVGSTEPSATWIGKQSFTAPEEEYPSVEIEAWSWYSSNGIASSSQTIRAYNALCEQGDVGDFSYLVWNDMVDKAKDILDASGDAWDNSYASYSQTRMTSTDNMLTADRFNSLLENITWHVSTGISTVSRGDVVYGWYFTRLTDCMNEWIDKL